MIKNVYKSEKHQFLVELIDLSLRMILAIFLLFCESDARDFYKISVYEGGDCYFLRVSVNQ